MAVSLLLCVELGLEVFPAERSFESMDTKCWCIYQNIKLKVFITSVYFFTRVNFS